MQIYLVVAHFDAGYESPSDTIPCKAFMNRELAERYIETAPFPKALDGYMDEEYFYSHFKAEPKFGKWSNGDETIQYSVKTVELDIVSD